MFFLYKSGKIQYTDLGNGPVIVLLHGYLESSEIWNGFANRLSASFRVINIDLPGHGLSDIFSAEHSMEFMAGAVKALIDNLGIGKVFVAGHSLGGYVALAFLELFPEMLAGYCLFHSHPFADSEAAIRNRKREIWIVGLGKKNLMYPDNVMKMFATSNIEKFSPALERSKQIASEIPAEGIIAVLNGMMNRPSRQALMEEGSVPCLWILGRMDNYINCTDVLSRVKLPSSTEVVILENSGHIGFIEEEEFSVEVVSSFIDKIANY